MKELATCLLVCALSAACAEEASGLAPVPVSLAIRSHENAGDFRRDDGWMVHLDEARVLLGPIYLRAPKRNITSQVWQWLMPHALAHGGHAQTLTEGQVIGEYLEQVAVDALHSKPTELGTIQTEAQRLDRLSIMLDEPRNTQAAKQTQGHHAWIVGRATNGTKMVEFSCGLDIKGDSDDAPENLEARRRIDQVLLPGQPALNGPAELTITLELERWFDLVDFETLVEGQNPCGQASSTMLGQWYLGVRRPEAFSAELEPEEP